VVFRDVRHRKYMLQGVDFERKFGRGEWIRTTDLLVPNQHLSTTYEDRSLKIKGLRVFCLGPIWTLKAKAWRTGPVLDPVWTLISTLVIHVLSRARAVASPFQNPDEDMLFRQNFKVAI
jgi:hypothetical protein